MESRPIEARNGSIPLVISVLKRKHERDLRIEQIRNQHFPTKISKFEVNYYIFDSSDAGISSSYIGSIVDKYKAVDIDTLDDWFFAEAIFYGIRVIEELS